MANKKVLYVGGLAEELDLNVLRSAFAPFGDILDINMPIDYSSNKHKGFAFIEYHLPEDAADAIDNMDNGEILGRTIRVNYARPMKYKDSTKPIWADDEYLRKTDVPDETAQEVAVDGEQSNAKNAEESSDSADGE